jgi:TPR repeat protein
MADDYRTPFDPEHTNLKELEAAATEGRPDAVFKLAYFLRCGRYLTKVDRQRSLELLRGALKPGRHLIAAFYGWLLVTEYGPSVRGEANRYFSREQERLVREAKQGNVYAELLLGAVHSGGFGQLPASNIERKKTAYRLFSSSAQKGEPLAQLMLSICYVEEFGVAGDIEEAFRWMREAADNGVAQAQFVVGRHIAAGKDIFGKGPEKDMELAVGWWREAAYQGWTESQIRLARWYEDQEDYNNAAYWRNEAAQSGNVEAGIKLAWHFQNGLGIEDNDEDDKNDNKLEAFCRLKDLLLRDGKTLATAKPDDEARKTIEQMLGELRKSASVICADGQKWLDWDGQYVAREIEPARTDAKEQVVPGNTGLG